MIPARDPALSAGQPPCTGLGEAREKLPRTKDDRRSARSRDPIPAAIPSAIVALHGRIGDRVYKTYRHRYGRNRNLIVVTRVASFAGYTPSAAQRTQRERMRAATAYAQRVYADPAAKAIYVAAARALGRQPFRLAVADHLAGRVLPAAKPTDDPRPALGRRVAEQSPTPRPVASARFGFVSARHRAVSAPASRTGRARPAEWTTRIRRPRRGCRCRWPPRPGGEDMIQSLQAKAGHYRDTERLIFSSEARCPGAAGRSRRPSRANSTKIGFVP